MAAATELTRQRVGLCMIVRDEEKRLARCLDSVLPWVGEAVVVDTGSADGTLALAAAMGARTLSFPWCDDFAKARNHALAAATREWVLVLDADERLVVDDPAAWARAMAATAAAAPAGADGSRGAPDAYSPAAYSIDCHDRIDDAGGGGVAVGPVLRLFRRAWPGMRYQGQVHEQLTAVAERRCPTAHARFLHIDHDGHTGAVVAEHRTLERNLRLARALADARPADPFSWFCLGQALQAGDPAGAETIACYEQALALLGPAQRDESYLAALWINLVRALVRAGRAREALDRAACGLRDFPDAPDLHFLRGKLLLDAGEPAAAARELEACLTPAATGFFLRQDPGAAGFAARTQLAICHLKLGDPARAMDGLRQAAAVAPPAFHLPRLLLGVLLVAGGAADEGEPLLRALVAQRPDDRDARLHWGRALLAQRRRGDAERALAPLAGDARAARLLDG
jgi:hypothetical protein